MVTCQVKELAKSMLAAKSFNATSAPAELDRWLRILADELSHRLTEDGLAHSRAPRTLSLSYRCCLYTSTTWSLGCHLYCCLDIQLQH